MEVKAEIREGSGMMSAMLWMIGGMMGERQVLRRTAHKIGQFESEL
jgi:hypothetical protein